MADGQLESIWSQLHYATRTLSPVRLVLKVALFRAFHCHSADEEGIPALPGPLMARGQNNRRPAR